MRTAKTFCEVLRLVMARPGLNQAQYREILETRGIHIHPSAMCRYLQVAVTMFLVEKQARKYYPLVHRNEV